MPPPTLTPGDREHIRAAIAKNVSDAMDSKDIKYHQLAVALGMDPSTMWRKIRTDAPPMPFKADELVRIAHYLGVPTSSLLPPDAENAA